MPFPLCPKELSLLLASRAPGAYGPLRRSRNLPGAGWGPPQHLGSLRVRYFLNNLFLPLVELKHASWKNRRLLLGLSTGSCDLAELTDDLATANKPQVTLRRASGGVSVSIGACVSAILAAPGAYLHMLLSCRHTFSWGSPCGRQDTAFLWLPPVGLPRKEQR